MEKFILNGYLWKVKKVEPDSDYLIDRTGNITLGTTDPETMCVYLANNLKGELLNRVMIHELGHCALFSFGLLDDIHRMTKKDYWMEAEEWVCNFIADYGMKIFAVAYSVLGEDAIHVVPYELEKMIS